MIKDIANIICSKATNQEKLKVLSEIENDISIAKDIISGKYTYCEECDDYYLTGSFLTKQETVESQICTYEDPMNSGGNEYKPGYIDFTYRICPKGHRHLINRRERVRKII